MKRKQAYRAPLCPGKSHLFLLTLFLISVLSLPANCQFYEPSEKTIRVGDPLPEWFFQTAHTAVDVRKGKETTLKLERYRGKLIILDFWATWCGGCLFSLNKLDTVTMAMKSDDFIVIPVTYQNAEKAQPAFQRFKWNMISIVSDTLLAQIFPHQGIPHQVWLKEDRVFAIPKVDYATAENIRRVINGDPVDLVMTVDDRMLDPLKPLFVRGNGEVHSYYRAKYSKITRYLPGYRKEKLHYLQKGDTTVLYANNLSITELFYEAYEDEIFPRLGFTEYSNMKKVVHWEIDSSLHERFFNPPRQSSTGNKRQDALYMQWLKRNRYGYELRYPGKISKQQACEMMQKDLSKLFRLYFNIEASVEKGPRHKYMAIGLLGSREKAENALKTKGKSSGIRSNDSKELYRRYNTPFYPHFLTRLKAAELVPHLTIPGVVNRTGISPDFRIDYELPKAINGNLDLAQRELAKYGLCLTVEEKQVPILVIRQKGIDNTEVSE